ncbi:MAG: serine hydrolase [Pseudomonadota bacterium]
MIVALSQLGASHFGRGARALLTAVAGLICVAMMLAAGALPAEARPPYASISVDAVTGKVLQSTNADSRRFPASLTKVMTLYVLFEELEAGRMNLDTRLNVSKFASQQIPSKIGVKPGQTIRVEDAILALVTKSANDVAVVVAENISGSQPAFAKRMTETARRMGMSKTTFRNASGLPNKEQVTTARDMATLGIQIQKRFPQYFHYFNRRSFSYRGATYRNHNRLLGRVKGVDGLKTGYIRASGFNLLSSMQRDGRRIVAVVIGGRTGARRNAAMTDLLNRTIKKAKPAPAGALIAARPIKLPDAPALPPRNPRRAVAMAAIPQAQQQPVAAQVFAPGQLAPAVPQPPVRQVVNQQIVQAPATQQQLVAQAAPQQLVQPTGQPVVHPLAAAQPTQQQALHPSLAQHTLGAQAAQLQQQQAAAVSQQIAQQMSGNGGAPTAQPQMAAQGQLAFVPSTMVPTAPLAAAVPVAAQSGAQPAITAAVPQFDAQGQRMVSTQRITLAPTGPAASSVATTLTSPVQGPVQGPVQLVQPPPAALPQVQTQQAAYRPAPAQTTTVQQPAAGQFTQAQVLPGQNVPAITTQAAQVLPGQIPAAGQQVALATPSYAPAATALPATPTARGAYSIQIGAVPNENSAHKLIALAQLKVGHVLADADPFTQVIDKNGAQLWRARFAGFDRSRAVNACAELKKKDFGCFPIRN